MLYNRIVICHLSPGTLYSLTFFSFRSIIDQNMLLCSVSIAFITIFFSLVCSHLSLANSGETAINLGSCTSEKEGICDGVLTGFEMLDNTLSSPSPVMSLKKFILRLVLDHGSAIAGVIAVIITLLNMVVYKKNKLLPALTEGLHRFSLDEIRSATNNFSDAFFIGRGGFGNVYRGLIDNGKRKVAIKRLSWLSLQGPLEFYNEVKALSNLKHANLVSLIGYCKESREMILVYEFMPHGTLADNLYKNPLTDISLSWEQRLRICIGVARGLDYLHTGSDCEIIHRDVKSSNILLDKDLKAKISDFGMSKIRENIEQHSHVTTMVKGTPGYLDPTYKMSRKLTTKSDVYSFGVVLFEVLCGKQAVKSRNEEGPPEIICWARGLIHDGHIDQIVDPRLEDQISAKCLKAFVEISEKCLHDDPKKRSTMAQLVTDLELLLEHVGENDTQMVQDLDVPDREIQRVDDVSVNTQTHTEETSTSLSFGLWPMEQRSKELIFADGPCHRFLIAEIIIATEDFSPNNVILHDGLYTLYRGAVSANGESVEKNVVIAHLNRLKKPMPDISLELQKVSYLDHPNIAPMVGYCCSNGEIFVVYAYDGQGSLNQFLNRNDTTWLVRIVICLGTAKALKYLHVDTGVKIVHGDISPSTILLCGVNAAKVITFGSILRHLNTRNAGELEYLPPEFADSAKLTEKSDVYLFGLLMLVVLCGKFGYYEHRLGRYPLRLPEAIEKKTLDQIINMNPATDMVEESLMRFLEVAFSCLSREQDDRPAMVQVVDGLIGVLSLQCEKIKKK